MEQSALLFLQNGFGHNDYAYITILQLKNESQTQLSPDLNLRVRILKKHGRLEDNHVNSKAQKSAALLYTSDR
jgi:hypothetical protein